MSGFAPPPGACERCWKPPGLCVCDLLVLLPVKTRVLILQHPQEPDHELGSARIAHLSLPGSILRVGLSVPNLKAALGVKDGDPEPPTGGKWVVLHLGSGLKGPRTGRPLEILDKQGAAFPEPPPDLAGLVVLDGTWSQAKALWWRNPWLLKLRRGILFPPRPSLYGRLRREPRRECLSTAESLGVALTAMGEPPEVEAGLLDLFAGLLDRYRARGRGSRARSEDPVVDSAPQEE